MPDNQNLNLQIIDENKRLKRVIKEKKRGYKNNIMGNMKLNKKKRKGDFKGDK